MCVVARKSYVTGFMVHCQMVCCGRSYGPKGRMVRKVVWSVSVTNIQEQDEVLVKQELQDDA